MNKKINWEMTVEDYEILSALIKGTVLLCQETARQKIIHPDLVIPDIILTLMITLKEANLSLMDNWSRVQHENGLCKDPNCTYWKRQHEQKEKNIN